MPAVIETFGLRKTYTRRRRRLVAVAGLDLTVTAGGVHGFLGPNGSGKTTTIRMLLGLVRADSGQMRLFDQPVPAALPSVIGRVGAVVESPKFFPSFTGRRNLELLAGAARVPRVRVDEALEVVGLRERAADRYKGYSLGMRQRLAIAATLLKSPDLLILDEPTNGLDPAGIRDVRATLRALAAAGTTVLLSSHVLAEVQQVCDSVTIINAGQHVATGLVRDVLARHATGQVRVGLADPVAGESLLGAAGFAVRRLDDHLLVDGVADPAAITETLARDGHFVRELTPVAADLESVFLELTGATAVERPLTRVDDPGAAPAEVAP